ncbi:MAG: hypothetical protein HIU88_12735 [Acidobacteria bacterium]|nr:hypothetical protein [Acidobacteriota bacterium]
MTGVSTTLPAGALACRSCGAAVDNPDPESVEVLSVWPRQIAISTRDIPVPSTEVRVTRCDICASRKTRALALVMALNLGSVPGPGEVEADRIDAALAALDVIGIRGDNTRSLTRTPGDLGDLVAAMAHIGGAASWTAGLMQGNDPATCAPRRWAHVPPELPRAAKTAYRALILRMMESPTACPPPTVDGALRGCLLCGRGSLKVKPSDAAEAWGKVERVQPGTLGGTSTPEMVAGFICPVCRTSVETMGAPGTPAVDRALTTYLGFTLMSGAQFRWPLGKAWAALPVGTDPNREPWGHLDTVRLAHQLDAARYVQRVPQPEDAR